MSRRNRRKKFPFIIIMIIVLLLGGSFFIGTKFFVNSKSDDNVIDKVDMGEVFANIIGYSNEQVDSDFLNWIFDNYGEEVLIELEREFKNNYSNSG